METGPTGLTPKQQYNIDGNQRAIKDTASWEDEVDMEFMQSVISMVTQSCVLPSPIPLEQIPAIILDAAGYFWENDDNAVEQRFYFIPNSELCKNNVFNKIIQLPAQIMSVQGCYRSSETMYGNLGDFSIERMMMSSYATFGGLGSIGGGMGAGVGGSYNGVGGFKLSDVVIGMYEIDTFKQTLAPTLSYNFNEYSKKLVILGDSKGSNIVIDAWKRVRLQDLYNSHMFKRYCICSVKAALAQIYGTFTFKYPGGVEINVSVYSDPAAEELENIKEWIANNHAADYFFQPNTI